MLIEIINATSEKISQNKIKKIVQKITKKIKPPFIDLSIAFVSTQEIKKLNNKYRRENKVTDVLSFNYKDSGEIIICYNKARKQAKNHKHSIITEIIILLIHAILHLKGYNHEKDNREAILMRKKEKEILDYLQEN